MSDESVNHPRRRAVVRACTVAAVGALIGALATVAVAWGSIWWLTPQGLDVSRSPPMPWIDREVSEPLGYEGWLIIAERRHGVVRVMSVWAPPGNGGSIFGSWPEDPPEPLCPSWAPFVHPTEHPRTTGSTSVIAEARGWPMLALAGGFVQTERQPDPTRDSQFSVATRTAILLDPVSAAELNGWQHASVIPLRPIPLGFVVNTIFYCAVAVVLWRGVPWMRAIVRRGRGACSSCGHTLAGLTRCPECGDSARARG